jgi:hypothetical protein
MGNTTPRILRVHSPSCNSACRPARRRARSCLGCRIPLPRSASPWHTHCYRCFEWQRFALALNRFVRVRP